MRPVLFVLSVLLAAVLALGLLLVQAPPDVVSVTVDGRQVEGPARVLVAGAAGVFALALLAAMCLIAAFFLAGASVFVAVLLGTAGLLFVVAGLPFLAPVAILIGLLTLARARRQNPPTRTSGPTDLKV